MPSRDGATRTGAYPLQHSGSVPHRKDDNINWSPPNLKDAGEQHIALGGHGIGSGVQVFTKSMDLGQTPAAVVTGLVFDPVARLDVVRPVPR
jgi:hypothetical protein